MRNFYAVTGRWFTLDPYARVVTAGAYVSVGGLVPFVVGPTPSRKGLAVIRLGGHREGSETGWECAAREAYEEAGLAITPVRPSSTFRVHWRQGEPLLSPTEWNQGDLPPVLVVPRGTPSPDSISLMYLAEAEGTPVASGEVRGLLLLKQSEVRQLCRERTTLKQFLNAGGWASLREEFDPELVLEPGLQLRLLAQMPMVTA